jgi:hypothetical protein
MKHLSILFIALFISSIGFAQDTTKIWKTGGKIGANFTEVGFYNWSKGGDNSLSGISYLQLFANKAKNGWTWDNQLDLEFGVLKNDGQQLKKAEDRIELNTKFGKKTKNEHWYYSGFLNFRTQFTEGFNYEDDSKTRISHIMSPGFLTIGLGMDFKPNDFFSALIAPLSSKTIFVMNQELADAGSFGVEAAEFNDTGMLISSGKNIRQEVGASATLKFKKDIFKNVNFETKLDLFSNYLEDPQNIDVDWQSILTMKVNKYLNVVFRTHLIYDDNTDIAWEDKDDKQHFSPITQFKQSLAVGLMYQF